MHTTLRVCAIIRTQSGNALRVSASVRLTRGVRYHAVGRSVGRKTRTDYNYTGKSRGVHVHANLELETRVPRH